jgi:hypothetical protein
MAEAVIRPFLLRLVIDCRQQVFTWVMTGVRSLSNPFMPAYSSKLARSASPQAFLRAVATAPEALLPPVTVPTAM